MTLPQRIARPVINWLVKSLFPNSLFFYGKGPLWVFDRVDQERGGSFGSTAALYLARRAHEAGATEISVEAQGVSVNGESIGDWRITVERTDFSGCKE